MTTGNAEPLEFDGNRGDEVEITMESDPLDPYLHLEDPDGNHVAENDDGASGLNAQITHTLASSGTYTVWATTYRDDTGEYDLSLDLLGTSRPVDLRAIQYGETRTGNVDTDDPTDPYDSGVTTGNAEPVVFDGNRGDEVEITMESSPLDPYLHLEDPSGLHVVENDDGASGLNAQFTHTLASSGTYTIWATTYRDDTGEYDLSLDRLGTNRPVDLRAIRYGETRTGNVDTDDPTDPYDSGVTTGNAEPVVFDGNRGDEVEITMESDPLDPYLHLEDPDGNHVAENDDGASGLNAQITHTLGSSGTFTIWATTYRDDTGEYDLSIALTN